MSQILYAEADDVLRTFDAQYVAELVDPSQDGVVDGPLLAAVVAGTSIDALDGVGSEAYTAAEQGAAIIAAALRVASGEIDTYIRQRYALPLTNLRSADAAVLQSACLYIARYHLADSDDRVSEGIRNRYRDTLTWLKDVAAGRALLDQTLPQSADARAAHRAVVRPGVSAHDWGAYP